MARALGAWAINRRGKISVRNLRYGPRTQLVRGMYIPNKAQSAELAPVTWYPTNTSEIIVLFYLLLVVIVD